MIILDLDQHSKPAGQTLNKIAGYYLTVFTLLNLFFAESSKVRSVVWLAVITFRRFSLENIWYWYTFDAEFFSLQIRNIELSLVPVMKHHLYKYCYSFVTFDTELNR